MLLDDQLLALHLVLQRQEDLLVIAATGSGKSLFVWQAKNISFTVLPSRGILCPGEVVNDRVRPIPRESARCGESKNISDTCQPIIYKKRGELNTKTFFQTNRHSLLRFFLYSFYSPLFSLDPAILESPDLVHHHHHPLYCD